MSGHSKRLALFLLMLALAGAVRAQSAAFTFDDGPQLGETPLLSAQQRNQAILDTLARHKVQAALFVTAGNGANRPESYVLAKAWGQAGQSCARS